MSIDPRRLLVLRAVRRSGSVLAAARALHLTPSGISQHLARLEAETGLTLVDRSRRGGGRSLVLTIAGQQLADHADRVADEMAAAEYTAEALRGRRSGPVRIGGFASVLDVLVAPAITRLSAANPAIEPHVTEIDDVAGTIELTAGNLDLLLCDRTDRTDQSPSRSRDVVEEDLLHDPFRVVVPATWSTSLSDDDLLRAPWITTPEDHTSHRRLLRICRNAGITPDCRHVCTESATMLALAGAGLGAAIVPELSLAYLPRAGVRVTKGAIDPGARAITVRRRPGAAEPGSVVAIVLDALHDRAAELADAAYQTPDPRLTS